MSALSLKDLCSRVLQGGPGNGAYATGVSKTANVEGCTIAANCVVTITNHYLTTGDDITISGDARMTPSLNGKWYVTVISADTFHISPNANLSSPLTTTNNAGSGSYGSCEIGRITALTGGTYVAVMFDVASTADHPAMEVVASVLERLWKLQQLDIGTPSREIIHKDSPRRFVNGVYSGAAARNKFAITFPYRVEITCDEDDINDTAIQNVFDYYDSD